MADWRNTPQNRALGILSEVLGGAKEIGNKARVPESFPLVGGLGGGDLLLGDAPEEIERWSYGNSPLKEQVPGVSPRYPDFKRGRAQGVADVALLPVAEAYGAAKAVGAAGNALGKAGVKGLRAATEGGFDETRRAAMRKIGGGLATAAQATGAGLGLKGIAEHLATKAEHAAPAVSKAAVRALGKSDWLAAIRKLNRRLDQEVNEAYDDLISEQWEGVTREEMEKVEEATRARVNDLFSTHDDAVRALRDAHPEFELPDEIELSVKRDPKFSQLDEAQQEAEIAKRLEEYGILPADKIESIVRQGGEYVDPEYGLKAVLDEETGQVVWLRKNPSPIVEQAENEGAKYLLQDLPRMKVEGKYSNPTAGSDPRPWHSPRYRDAIFFDLTPLDPNDLPF